LLFPVEVFTTLCNALRLLRLVNSLLDFSRLEAGRLQATFEPTDLAELTRTVDLLVFRARPTAAVGAP